MSFRVVGIVSSWSVCLFFIAFDRCTSPEVLRSNVVVDLFCMVSFRSTVKAGWLQSYSENAALIQKAHIYIPETRHEA